ncbi:MAG: glycosyltransferase [Planctomycetota bacterium]
MSGVSTSLRIAFIHPDLGIGGAERLVIEAALSLQRRGHQVCIFTASHDPDRAFVETCDGTLDVRVHGRWIPMHVAGGLRAPLGIARMEWLSRVVAKVRPGFDVIVCDVVSHRLRQLRRRFGGALLFYCHFPDLLLSRPREQRWYRFYRAPIDRMERAGLRAVDAVLVNSRFTAGVLTETFPNLSGDMVQVLHPGVEIEPLRQAGITHKAFAFPDEGDAPIELVVVGRFSPEKNPELAVLALIALRDLISAELFDRVRLTLAGGYDERLASNRDTWNALHRQVAEAGLAKHVEFQQSITEDQKRTLIARARVVIYPPIREHFGIVPVEAMAAGRPVLAVSEGGPLETVVDGETGFLREARPEAFAEALAILVSQPNEASRMGRNGRKRVEACFSLEAFGDRFNAIIRDAVADRSRE